MNYLVKAYRWGEPDIHVYIVGTYLDENQACQEAKNEKYHRGGKYAVKVLNVKEKKKG